MMGGTLEKEINPLASDSLDWIESFYTMSPSVNDESILTLVESMMQPIYQESAPVAQP